MSFVADLASIPADALSQVGSKAFNLSRALQAGLPTPRGFVVTVEAFAYFLSENGLADLLSQGSGQDGHDMNQALERVQTSIRTAPIPPVLLDAIRNALQALGTERLAVRSSSVAEDLHDFSFAGQYESFLDVRGERQVVEAIRHCWASAFSRRSMSYSGAAGPALMAVLVQEFVPAAVAGVMFTADPGTGDANVMVIEAVLGTGESLVGGQTSPSRWILNRPDGTVVSAQEAADGPTQDRTPLRELCTLGLQLEALFGHRCDVEWAALHGKPVILQVRPITGLLSWGDAGPVRSWPFDLWDRVNVAEVLPGPITPLSWSLWAEPFNVLLRSAFRHFRLPWLDEVAFIKQESGLLYYNIGAVNHITHNIIGFPRLDEVLGGASTDGVHLARWEDFRWSKLLANLAGLARNYRANEAILKESDRHAATIEQLARQYAATNLSQLCDSDLLRLFEQLKADTVSRMYLHSDATGASFTHYVILRIIVHRWCGDDIVVPALVSGLSGVRIAETGPWLYNIAQLASGIPRALDALRNLPLDSVLAAWRQMPDAEPILQELDRFLAAFGHRCSSELELMTPRWADDPTPLIMAIRQYATGTLPNPTEVHAEQERKRLAVTAEVERRLAAIPYWRGRAIKMGVFREILHKAQRFAVYRENNKHYLWMLLTQMRRIIVEMGRRLAERGYLRTVDHVFFLTFAEATDGLLGRLPPVVTLRLAERRERLYRRYQMQALQPVSQADHAGSALAGLAASPGRFRGRARVLHQVEEGYLLEPGDVLVAPSLDIGWTPVFLTAGAVVTGLGGMLSHAAIVLREYQIPAVVNVPNACTAIRTGDLVEVDADQGLVRVIAPSDRSVESSIGR